MTALLHLSDTHFGTAVPEVTAALERMVRAEAPGLAVLSGDVTQRATRAQFAEAKAFIGRLAIPQWVTIPGNHDIPLFDLGARLFNPYGRYREALGAALAPAADTPDWLVLSANTTRWYRHEHGEISPAQIAATAARLAHAARAQPRQIRVVAVHQPVAVQQAEDVTNLLRGAAEAVRAWSDAGADVILGGHIHLPFVVPLHRRQPLARPTWAVQAGTAVSSRIRAGAPNSVNLLRMASDATGRRCAVERWDYDASIGAFGLMLTNRLDLAPALTVTHTDTAF